MKKYYKLEEKIYIKTLHTTGIVKGLEPQNLIASVELPEGKIIDVKFFDMDKYHEPKQIIIKYFDETLPKINKIKIGDWVDLYSAENIIFKQFEFKLIPLNVAMQLPKGFEANIVPRSSTFKNFGILQTNSYSVIDNSYCGDNDMWQFPVLAMRDTKIKKGDRICQFRINRTQPKIEFVEVKELNNPDRMGIGSTGK